MQQTTKPWYAPTWGKVMNIGGGALDFGFTYAESREKGDGVAKSAIKGAAVAAGWYVMPGVMWGMQALDWAHSAGQAVAQYRQQSYEEQFAANDARGIVGNGFQDTAFGYTSRQRGMAAIQQSRLNARSALNNEARSLHRF